MSEPAEIEHIKDKRIALLIAVLALCLALVETGAKGTQTAAITDNVEANDLWAYYQARTVRQTTVRTAVQQAELTKLTLTDPAARTAVEAQQKVWTDMDARWEDDPKGGDGRKQIQDHAHAVEHRRDESLAKYPLYEYAGGLFQIAIVIVSASIVTGVTLLAFGGSALALGGAVLGVLGFAAPHLIHF